MWCWSLHTETHLDGGVAKKFKTHCVRSVRSSVVSDKSYTRLNVSVSVLNRFLPLNECDIWSNSP